MTGLRALVSGFRGSVRAPRRAQVAIACALLLGLPGVVRAQAASRSAVLTAARDVMQRARYATLITIGADGQPEARIVDPLVPDAQMTIWIGTNPVTRKVADVRRDPRVTLMYFDATGNEYVSVVGHARVVTGSAERSRHWKPEWGPFYRNGASGADFVLLRVTPTRLEIVSPRHKLINDSLTWRPVTVTIP